MHVTLRDVKSANIASTLASFVVSIIFCFRYKKTPTENTI